MASTTNNGATVDNLNVLDTLTADNTGGAEIVELQDVANVLFPTSNATQTLTIDSTFWTGNLTLTFQDSAGLYYTLAATSVDNFTLVQSDSFGNPISGAALVTFSATSAATFLSAFSTNSGLKSSGLASTSLLTGLDITGAAGKNVFQATINSQIANVFSYSSATDSFNGTGSQWDVINGFNQGVDKIDLRKLVNDSYAGSSSGLTSKGLDELIWSGTAASKYGVWYASDGSGGSFVYADTNGDGVADLKIDVAGIAKLLQSDFLGVGTGAPSITINPIEATQSNPWVINAADAASGSIAVSGTTTNVAVGTTIQLTLDGTNYYKATVQLDGSWKNNGPTWVSSRCSVSTDCRHNSWGYADPD